MRPETPHLLGNRSSFANSYALISEEGASAVLIDFGYDAMTGLVPATVFGARRPLRWTAGRAAARSRRRARRGGARDALPRRPRGGLNLMREVTGTEVWAPANVAPILEDPARHDLPCLWFDPIPVDRVLELGRPVAWRGYEIATTLPGHTRYAAASPSRSTGAACSRRATSTPSRASRRSRTTSIGTASRIDDFGETRSSTGGSARPDRQRALARARRRRGAARQPAGRGSPGRRAPPRAPPRGRRPRPGGLRGADRAVPLRAGSGEAWRSRWCCEPVPRAGHRSPFGCRPGGAGRARRRRWRRPRARSAVAPAGGAPVRRARVAADVAFGTLRLAEQAEALVDVTERVPARSRRPPRVRWPALPRRARRRRPEVARCPRRLLADPASARRARHGDAKDETTAIDHRPRRHGGGQRSTIWEDAIGRRCAEDAVEVRARRGAGAGERLARGALPRPRARRGCCPAGRRQTLFSPSPSDPPRRTRPALESAFAA